jgi:ketosteroid isomerase-like protein
MHGITLRVTLFGEQEQQEIMTMVENEHPARRAALLSREYVRSGNRAGWLALFAEDAVIEDPIGISPIDPEGKGHRGPAAREAFWDNFIAPATINMDIIDSFAAGNEVANRVEINVSVDLGDGKALQQTVQAIVAYCVDEAGMLASLRAWWEIDDPRNAMREIAGTAGDGLLL